MKKVIIMFLVIAFMVSIGFSFIVDNSILKYFAYNSSTKSNNLIYRHKEIELHIPRNYFWSWSSVRGDQVFQPNLYFLYPEMKGKTEQNSHVFKSLSWGNHKKMTFVFSPNGRFTMEQIVERKLNQLNVKSIKEVTTKFEIFKNTGVRQDTYFPIPINENNYYFICGKKTELFISPSCTVLFDFSDSLKIKLSFSKEKINEGTEIVSSLKQLLTTFKQNKRN